MKAWITFEKKPRLRHIGHLDLMRAMQRALRRSGLPIAYSNGFNPHIVMSFASALSSGIPGDAELLDVSLKGEATAEEIDELEEAGALKDISHMPARVKCAVLFDREAEGLTGAELLWLAAADSDPRRDVTVVGEVVVVDARSKRPGVEGHPARFPNVAVASSATVERVDARWAEYGLGETMASPSERYRRLLLSDKAAW